MTYEKEKNPKCYPKKKRKKTSCCRHVHLYIANILAAFSPLYTDAHCAEWINTQLTSGIKSLLFYMDLQEWVPFSSSYSIDCTFIPQIYSCKYCNRNHRNTNSYILLYIAENNLQCQPSLHSTILPGVPKICGTSLKNLLLPNRYESQILSRCRLERNRATII